MARWLPVQRSPDHAAQAGIGTKGDVSPVVTRPLAGTKGEVAATSAPMKIGAKWSLVPMRMALGTTGKAASNPLLGACVFVV